MTLVTNARPRMLCVDDEKAVLEGLSLHLRRGYDVVTALGGEAGLAAIETEGPFAIVLSDMRMPGMDGAAFLGRARQTAPDTVRMLLTGYTDLESAIAVVNQGQIFRFLVKPCPPKILLGACEAAAEQHRLITAERVLLHQTVRGSIEALVELLTLTSPITFGRATRLKRYAGELWTALGLKDLWQIEVAAMLSQVGCVTLPQVTMDKLYHGRELGLQEKQLVEQLPKIAADLIAHIPRLEPIQEILLCQSRHYDGSDLQVGLPIGESIPLGGRILKIACDYDLLDSQDLPLDVALGTLQGRTGWYDTNLLASFAALRGCAAKQTVCEVAPSDLRVGMTLAGDVRTPQGVLLIARGYEVTANLLERLRNLPVGTLEGPIRVLPRKERAGAAGDATTRR